MKSFHALILIIAFSFQAKAQLQSPDEFLPHKLGEHFTPHYMLVDYFEHVADNSPLVKLIEYGRTNQDRPMLLAVITSEANHQRLEEIRLNNLRMTGLEAGEVNAELSKAMVWLSFSVHGNEAAGSESSKQVLFDLVDPSTTRTKAWLENTVVFIDPSVNPDGYSRYTHWVRSTSAAENNPDINDIEHNEPWPGGRVNHYLFDLNRDWAWQTQIESQQRMEIYNDWLPHVHVDLHEMGHESPYYFAPAARPYHKYLTKWQRDFQVTIGKNHATYFDENGWRYFTKEVFDLFYPSYGDTYPMFSGAVGMTYEQGGSHVGGRGVNLKNGEILTLADRIEHHRTTALSTIEISSINANEVIGQFHDFYKDSSTKPLGKYKSYIIKKDASGNRLKALAKLLDKQDISYGTVSKTKAGNGFDYHTRMNGSFLVEEGDMIVSALQPKSVLAQVLLNPENELEDSLTYDITAWSLPYAYGLHAYSSTQVIAATENLNFDKQTQTISKAYSYLIPWETLADAQLVSALLKEGIVLRTSPKEIEYEGRTFGRGTAIITRADNAKMGDKLYETINAVLKNSDAKVVPIASGFATSGPDIGSSQMELIPQPKILTIMGDRVSSYEFGQIKWYFDQIIKYPITMVNVSDLSGIDLDGYNTIILPNGWYQLQSKDEIATWVNKGGKLIVMGRAIRNFVDTDGFSIKRYATDDAKDSEETENKQADLAARYNHYSDAERQAISDFVPGAIFKLELDETHPLAFGLGDSYYSLRVSGDSYPLMVDGANVIYHPKENAQVIGFSGAKARKKLLDSVVFAVENKGQGKVVYMVDIPLYRGFWYNGLFLMGNALFQVN